MSDTIDRQAAIDAAERESQVDGAYGYMDTKSIVDMLNDLPSAQPEIIKCKDCLHLVRTCGDNQWGLGDCDVFEKHLVMCEGYCAWAERRSDG